jgi:hypothetical protein
MIGQGGSITRRMQHTNDHKLPLIVHAIDRVIAGETHAQTGRKIFARGRREREMEQRLAIILDLVEEPRRYGLGSLSSNIEPDVGEVGFRRVG